MSEKDAINVAKAHSPQDQLYGPLQIPNYCWPIIDTPEFQRLRYISQLGGCSFVYPCANHSRFEHSLGCCHLATIFMDHFRSIHQELNIEEEHKKIVVLAALCHDLGHGILSHAFDYVASQFGVDFEHCEMSVKIFKHIVKKYKLNIDESTIKAVSCAIRGKKCDGYPEFLFSIVANENYDIDIDKFDYLTRDMNRTICIQKFEFDRLIVNCRIHEGKLAWKSTEMSTIERLFFNRIDMHIRVYKHIAVLAVELMLRDALTRMFEEKYYDINVIMDDPEEFCKLDERVFYKMELNDFNDEVLLNLMNRIKFRDLYKSVGYLRLNEKDNYSYSHKDRVRDCGVKLMSFNKNIKPEMFRIASVNFKYHSDNARPLNEMLFYDSDTHGVVKLTDKDLYCIVPASYTDRVIRVYCTDKEYYSLVSEAFEMWKAEVNAQQGQPGTVEQ